MKLKTALKKKGAHIYYHDNGCWVIYARKPKNDEDIPKELYSGSDFDGYGYESPLVVALAEMLGITVDSV